MRMLVVEIFDIVLHASYILLSPSSELFLFFSRLLKLSIFLYRNLFLSGIVARLSIYVSCCCCRKPKQRE